MKQEDLIKEEQKILNNLIREMDKSLLQLNKNLTTKQLQAEKAKASCLPDAYGMLVSAEHEKLAVRQAMRELRQGKDELYETRLVLDLKDDYGRDRKEIKIGLHTYLNGARIFIMSWKMPLCRHYILDNSAEEYDGVVTGKHGERYITHFKLRLKRQINMLFDKVQNVTQVFPITNEEIEQVVADEFLKELLNRRSGQEFKNIVFSIQKKQGQIIQTPFKQDLIVQGCAGSGKSMIMLHRLPIILYDNPNSLDRNNLYIITPSTTYIQMANNMRIDLEIADLKMGTLEQYYDYVLAKYGVDSKVYGTINPYIKIKYADLNYIYSSKCIQYIHNKINESINGGNIDYQKAYTILDLKEKPVQKKSVTPADRILEQMVKIQAALNENNNNLEKYHRIIYALITELKEYARMLETRKIAVIRGITKQITDAKKIIKENEKEISKIDDLDNHKIKYNNHLNSIRAAQNRIIGLKEKQELVNLDNDYFEILKKEANRIHKLLELFAIIKSERIEMSLAEQYKVITNKEFLCSSCRTIVKEVSLIEDPYWEYTNSIVAGIDKVEQALIKLETKDSLYLPQDYHQRLSNANAYYSEITNNIVHKIYLSLMEWLGQKPDEKDNLEALECSPYLYLQILYQFKGAPNGNKESLITIDEAQNMAPEELRLIKAVNNNRVVLNLFGDVKQHVEDSKGIDDWDLISDVAKFKKEYMEENYRNARQITEYCNKRFRLNMRAINLDGKGVHKVTNTTDFEESFIRIFQKPQNIGLSCIIVKNKEEAITLMNKSGIYASRIHDMTKEVAELQRRKWNLMTVEQAKGLEFETVYAITGRMSENEKYVTYTRALDELYVYDKEIELSPENNTVTESTKEINKKTKEGSNRKKREKRKSKEINKISNN